MIGLPNETAEGRRCVALVPEVVTKLVDLGAEVRVERSAGNAAYLYDAAFEEAGAVLVDDGDTIYADSDVVVRIHPPEASEITSVKKGAILIGFLAPFRGGDIVTTLRDNGVTSIAMELVPRISRAQAMDALSSQASIAGYKAALMAANLLGKFMPMLTTPTGTIRPAQVIVIGAGVAGLQAVATARRLGAIVSAYDVRSATKEQIQSLGAKFIELDISAEGEGGYARELTDEEKKMQQDQLGTYIARADAVITTAAIPGRASPKIIKTEMVEAMRPGSVIIDLAAEGGGNCELTKAGEMVDHGGVNVYGPLKVPDMVPVHASETFAKNIYNMIALMVAEGEFSPDWEDDVLSGSLLTRDGEIIHEATKQMIEGSN